MKIAICDDNEDLLKNMHFILQNIFKQYTSYFEIFSFSSGNLLLKSHKESNFDVIFLDIDMPEINGFDVAKNIRMGYSGCRIIFITSHSEFVYDSFDFQPFDFIRKDQPEALDKSFANVVRKLMRHMKQNEIMVLEDEFSKKYPIPIRNIIYLESNKHYINYYVLNENKSFKDRCTIKECENRFEIYDFIRIHKSYIINPVYIDFIDNRKDEIILKHINLKLPMSRNYKKIVNEKYTLYLRNTI